MPPFKQNNDNPVWSWGPAAARGLGRSVWRPWPHSRLYHGLRAAAQERVWMWLLSQSWPENSHHEQSRKEGESSVEVSTTYPSIPSLPQGTFSKSWCMKTYLKVTASVYIKVKSIHTLNWESCFLTTKQQITRTSSQALYTKLISAENTCKLK